MTGQSRVTGLALAAALLAAPAFATDAQIEFNGTGTGLSATVPAGTTTVVLGLGRLVCFEQPVEDEVDDVLRLLRPGEIDASKITSVKHPVKRCSPAIAGIFGSGTP
ncbi:MAG: hypothetical protein VYB54_00385 [Pseudomonadota bacterium]|nr:hypothetical protein [Pseudomonadota bacterium]